MRDKLTKDKKGQLVTCGIANKGFIGMRRVEARFNFSYNLTGNRPQSLTGHTATVTSQCGLRSKTCSIHQAFFVYGVTNWTIIKTDWFYCFGF